MGLQSIGTLLQDILSFKAVSYLLMELDARPALPFSKVINFLKHTERYLGLYGYSGATRMFYAFTCHSLLHCAPTLLCKATLQDPNTWGNMVWYTERGRWGGTRAIEQLEGCLPFTDFDTPSGPLSPPGVIAEQSQGLSEHY